MQCWNLLLNTKVSSTRTRSTVGSRILFYNNIRILIIIEVLSFLNKTWKRLNEKEIIVVAQLHSVSKMSQMQRLWFRFPLEELSLYIEPFSIPWSTTRQGVALSSVTQHAMSQKLRRECEENEEWGVLTVLCICLRCYLWLQREAMFHFYKKK